MTVGNFVVIADKNKICPKLYLKKKALGVRRLSKLYSFNIFISVPCKAKDLRKK